MKQELKNEDMQKKVTLHIFGIINVISALFLDLIVKYVVFTIIHDAIMSSSHKFPKTWLEEKLNASLLVTIW